MARGILAVVSALVLAGAGAVQAPALGRRGFGLDVVVNGVVRPEYPARGTTYIEALRGREYVLRLTNPLPRRVAVALAVDGLNTIDARHTSPEDARKWVLEPYQTIEITGWQVSPTQARRFFFTSEPESYGAFLGRTDNLGVIEAAVFRERGCCRAQAEVEGRIDKQPRRPSGVRGGVPGGVPEAAARGKAMEELSDESVATGIGDRTHHPVHQVAMDLEHRPYVVLRLRYELRPQLVELGVIPGRVPLDRRERATGFAGDYCPEPD
jgi:hypothetical protein